MIPIPAVDGDIVKKAGIVVGGAALIGVGIWGVNKLQKEQDARNTANKYGSGSNEGLAVQYAGLMHSALHSGWFNMTEDEKALYATAIKIHQNGLSFSLVSNAYRSLYQLELVKELNRLLSPQELIIFNNALQGNYQKL